MRWQIKMKRVMSSLGSSSPFLLWTTKNFLRPLNSYIRPFYGAKTFGIYLINRSRLLLACIGTLFCDVDDEMKEVPSIVLCTKWCLLKSRIASSLFKTLFGLLRSATRKFKPTGNYIRLRIYELPAAFGSRLHLLSSHSRNCPIDPIRKGHVHSNWTSSFCVPKVV